MTWTPYEGQKVTPLKIRKRTIKSPFFTDNITPEQAEKVVKEVMKDKKNNKRLEILEWEAQAKLVSWARSKGFLLISIPNAGKRSQWGGQRERAMGLTAGVADLFLAMPNRRYSGYFIEMKSKGKKPTPLQNEWFVRARAQNYCCDWFDDWQKARESIENYLSFIEKV